MKAVYVVQHTHIINDDEEDVKLIGVYLTEQQAQEAVQRLRRQPGFCDTPNGFYIRPPARIEILEFITTDEHR